MHIVQCTVSNTLSTPILTQREQQVVLRSFKRDVALLLAQHQKGRSPSEISGISFIKKKATLLRYDLTAALKRADFFNDENAARLDTYLKVLNRFIDKRLFVPQLAE